MQPLTHFLTVLSYWVKYNNLFFFIIDMVPEAVTFHMMLPLLEISTSCSSVEQEAMVGPDNISSADTLSITSRPQVIIYFWKLWQIRWNNRSGPPPSLWKRGGGGRGFTLSFFVPVPQNFFDHGLSYWKNCVKYLYKSLIECFVLFFLLIQGSRGR